MGSPSADGVAGRFTLVTAEIVEDDNLTPCQGGCQLDIEGEEFAVDGTVDEPGRADPIAARAATKVMVFQCPKGADPRRRCPLSPQPRNGAMLVFIQVSFDEDQARRHRSRLDGPSSASACGRCRRDLARRAEAFF